VRITVVVGFVQSLAAILPKNVPIPDPSADPAKLSPKSARADPSEKRDAALTKNIRAWRECDIDFSSI
jgi:hypothetical protein